VLIIRKINETERVCRAMKNYESYYFLYKNKHFIDGAKLGLNQFTFQFKFQSFRASCDLSICVSVSRECICRNNCDNFFYLQILGARRSFSRQYDSDA